ncbi:hypothetical protein DYI24_06105 [Rhodopseudomonas sp. BR0C11]|uniref:hypothetical protein n=1 Tax=Rhodopseudomonas sp. BR0C11 TaxID=2269370 RepID=UPI0013DEE5C5|nr:hypothetical protein [Rhodopseudomonas sp. BR0C11]NEV76613.1 hypothetical protein [Rhodopseudomonas sp. BR0C11]
MRAYDLPADRHLVTGPFYAASLTGCQFVGTMRSLPHHQAAIEKHPAIASGHRRMIGDRVSDGAAPKRGEITPRQRVAQPRARTARRIRQSL